MSKFLFLLLLMLILMGCGHESRNAEDTPIQESHFLPLGGEPQYVEISAASRENPILLFIHGGPAWPQTPQLRYFSSELADEYTLVIWEQRGAGKNYARNPNPDQLSLAQIIQDGHELSQWLKKTYQQEKIYLAGYSWGSLVGVLLAETYPEDYLAYIGIAQMVHPENAMQVSQDWLTTKALEANDQAALIKLDSLKHPEFYDDKLDRFFNQWLLLNKYRGALHNLDAVPAIDSAMVAYEDYKDYDWMGVWEYSAKILQNDMFAARVDTIDSLPIPVFLLQGRHDWNVPSVMAAAWLDELEAPQKQIFWFENSGHGLLEEEPTRFNEVMKEIVRLKEIR